MSFERPRRLSARRGSISAPDPFAKNAEHHRSSFSTLTIVQVSSPKETSSPAAPQSTISLKEPPAGRSRFSGSISNRRHPPNDGKADSPRLSFAFNTFAPARGPPSPGSPRSQNSPIHQRSRSSTSTKLSPEQLYELAKQASSPRPRSRSTSNMTPSPGARSSPGSPYLQHHRGISDPSLSPGSATFASPHIAPAKFRPLPESIHLPFIDRPAEVASLISSSPTNRLLALLKQTFPPATQSPSSGSSSPKSYFGSHTPLADLPEDPAQWSYGQLHAFLTTAPRSRFPDALYVKKVKACILARSELIWERVRGALGVPDELNDEEYLNSVVSEQESYMTDSDDTDGPHTSDLDDIGVKGRSGGDWDSWDSVLCSPGSDRKLFSHIPSLSRRTQPSSLHDIEPLELSASTPIPIPGDVGISFEDQMDDRLTSHVEGKASSLLSVPATEGDNTVSPTPRSASPVYQIGGNDSEESLTSYGVIIEPMLSSSDPKGSSPVPPAMSVSDSITGGLGGIAEDEEDEGEVTPGKEETSVSPDPHIEEIHGLRICTSAASPLGSPKSNPRHITSSPDLTPRRSSRTPSLNGHESDGNESDYAYNPMADRTPGNPLFPSNFARLTAGPNLIANNPSLRSAAPPPAPRYHSGFYQTSPSSHSPSPGYLRPSTGLRSGFMSHFQKKNRLSRDMSDISSSDYAITIGSGSSAVSVE